MTPREFTIRAFFDEIKDLQYVVQRNWDNLPADYVIEGHGDLDLFATDKDKLKIKEILKKYPDIMCDIFSPEDNYYPSNLATILLYNRIGLAGFWIPSPTVAFNVLYYHNLIHKKDNPYKEKLDRMFKQLWYPVRCKDQGVGFYDTN